MNRITVCTLGGVLAVATFAEPVALRAEGGGPPAVAAESSMSESHSVRDGRELVGYALIDERGSVHGEVAIFRTEESQIVETLLYSRVLKRVVAEIALRESEAWPTGKPGAADSVAYVEALQRAQKKVWWLASNNPQSRDRLQEMSIDLEVRENAANVSFFSVRTRDGSDDRRHVVGRDLLETLAVSREYALRSQRLIVSDTFGIGESKAAILLDRAVSQN